METGEKGEATCCRLLASVRDDGIGWIISIIIDDDEAIQCECLDRAPSSVVYVQRAAGMEAWLSAWDACQSAVLRSVCEYIEWNGVFAPREELSMKGRIFHHNENIDRYW